MDSDIPNEFVCPITMEIMTDPVVMPDGQTYERSAIARHLSNNPTSPITRQPMSMADAKVNYALKSLIDRFRNNGENPTKHQLNTKVHELQGIELDRFDAKYMPDKKKPGYDLFDIAIKPKDIESRVPVALVAMIDVSGSMYDNACESVKGMEDINLSRLQLVQHSLKTVVSTLGDQDQVVFIEFEGNARVIMEATQMDASGKANAITVIDNMEDKGSTNIWDALRLGVQHAKSFSGRGYNTSMLLFTDGEPNINPPRGIIPELQELLSGTDVDFTISTFAFGYHVDSKLMEDIARLGNGIYGYCPDCTMVGTIFINYMANILTTITPLATVSIDHPSYQVKHYIGLYNGATRHILISLPHENVNQANVQLTFLNTDEIIEIKSITEATSSEDKNEIINQYYREQLIELMKRYLNNPKGADVAVESLYNEIDAIDNKTPFMESLLIDLINPDDNHGQIEKAFRPDFFKKWGANYLRSLSRFHIVEQCGNFKDDSLQGYASKQFSEVRTVANKLFLDIPAPAQRPDRYNQQSFNRANAAPIQMARFANYAGGCFNGDAIVELSEGTKKVRDLIKGDILSNGGIVQCIVITKVNETIPVIEINNVLFTPYHPIQQNSKWVFPISIGNTRNIYIDNWYNLVIEGSPVVRLNGVNAITLGHNMTNDILSHPYFGTKMVIDALKKYDSFELGKIEIEKPKEERNENGLIIKYY